MPKFYVEAQVDRLVTTIVEVLVTARDEESATLKAKEALQDYPDPIKTEGILRVFTSKVNNWIPRDIEIRGIERTK